MPKVVFTNSFLSEWYVGEYDLFDYYERPQAFFPKKAEEHSAAYDMLDYMANTEKSDGIFTADKDLLSAEDVELYRDRERHSMEVGCPKYVQVVSFDNSFLEENHIMINGEVDKAKLRDAFRKSMAALIERETKFQASNCYWVAAIHTNTDNIHIHSSLLEFERLEDRVKKYKDGDMISLDAMNRLKSTMAQELIEVNERTKEHTKIERELLLPALKKSFSATTAQMVELRRELPPEGGWQYNRPKMRKYQPRIDAVVDNIIASNDVLTKLFNQYKSSLDALTNYYADFYGEGITEQSLRYTTNKLDDFYSRAGNSLLKALEQIEIADFSDTPAPFDDAAEYIPGDFEYASDEFEDIPDVEGEEIVLLDNSLKDNGDTVQLENSPESDPLSPPADYPQADPCIDFRKLYKKAMEYLYGDDDTAPDMQKAAELLYKSANSGNVVAQLKLGDMYKQGIIPSDNHDDDEQLANKYYSHALYGLHKLIEKGDYKNPDYLNYLMGKLYQIGRGCEKDPQKAFECFSNAPDNKYALFSLGNCYRFGVGTDKDDTKAVEMYVKASEMGMPYAAYAAAECFERGIGVEIDPERAYELYNAVLQSFLIKSKDKNSDNDDNLKYRLGCMYLQGKGCEADIDKAVEWLEKAAELHNDKAEYTLGRFYLDKFDNEPDKIQRGVALLERQAEKDNPSALYALGRRYLTEKKLEQKGVEYLQRAADNHGHEFAQYALGKHYLDNNRVRYAEKYLSLAAQKDNSFAYYQLGRLYNIKSRPDKAMACFKKSSELGNEFAKQYLAEYAKRQSRRRYAPAYKRRFTAVRAQMRSAAAALDSMYHAAEAHLREMQREFEYENDIQSEEYDIDFSRMY